MKSFDYFDCTLTAEPSRNSMPGLFDPADYVDRLDDSFSLCRNPSANGGLAAMTVNTSLTGESRRNFESSIKRMVLAKLISPKFAEVILFACRMDTLN